jgi:hypothetical protein
LPSVSWRKKHGRSAILELRAVNCSTVLPKTENLDIEKCFILVPKRWQNRRWPLRPSPAPQPCLRKSEKISQQQKKKKPKLLRNCAPEEPEI